MTDTTEYIWEFTYTAHREQPVTQYFTTMAELQDELDAHGVLKKYWRYEGGTKVGGYYRFHGDVWTWKRVPVPAAETTTEGQVWEFTHDIARGSSVHRVFATRAELDAELETLGGVTDRNWWRNETTGEKDYGHLWLPSGDRYFWRLAHASREIKLSMVVCDISHYYTVTFATEDQAIAYLKRKRSTHAWFELAEAPVPYSCERLLAYLYPTCSHGLSADLCAGPGHYPADHPAYM